MEQDRVAAAEAGLVELQAGLEASRAKRDQLENLMKEKDALREQDEALAATAEREVSAGASRANVFRACHAWFDGFFVFYGERAVFRFSDF